MDECDLIQKVIASDMTKKVLVETFVNLRSRGHFEFVVQLEKVPSWKVRNDFIFSVWACQNAKKDVVVHPSSKHFCKMFVHITFFFLLPWNFGVKTSTQKMTGPRANAIWNMSFSLNKLHTKDLFFNLVCRNS